MELLEIYSKLLAHYGDMNWWPATVKQKALADVRSELLSIKGVGQETADSILLYAFEFPTFVVDAYTMRLCDRFPFDAGKDT